MKEIWQPMGGGFRCCGKALVRIELDPIDVKQRLFRTIDLHQI
jgi:hypothetical protein